MGKNKYHTLQVALVVKNPPADVGDMRLEFNPWVRKIPWRREWLPTPAFLTGKSQEQRSLRATVHGVIKALERT